MHLYDSHILSSHRSGNSPQMCNVSLSCQRNATVTTFAFWQTACWGHIGCADGCLNHIAVLYGASGKRCCFCPIACCPKPSFWMQSCQGQHMQRAVRLKQSGATLIIGFEWLATHCWSTICTQNTKLNKPRPQELKAQKVMCECQTFMLNRLFCSKLLEF